MLSTEAHVAFSPDSTYRALVSDNEPVGAWRMLRRPLVVLVVIATAVPVMALKRVTLDLLVFSALSFAFVVVIQLLVGAAIIGTARSRRVTVPRAVDLWFAGHAPYSLWLLAASASFSVLPYVSLDALMAIAAFPAAWTAVIVAAFCRQVLCTGTAGARWRAMVHFAVIWAIAFEVVALGAGGWFQITRSITRLWS